MALTTQEKRILRRANAGKTDDEIEAIGSNDTLARVEIALFIERATARLTDAINYHQNEIDKIQAELDIITGG